MDNTSAKHKWTNPIQEILIWFIFLYFLFPHKNITLLTGQSGVFANTLLLVVIPLIAIGLSRFADKKTVTFTLPDLLVITGITLLYIISFLSSVNPELVAGWMVMSVFWMLFRNISINRLPDFLLIFPLAILFQTLYSIHVHTNWFDHEKGIELIKGYFTNTALWGALVSTSLIVATGSLIYTQMIGKRILWGVYIIVAFPLLICTDSRAAWLGTVSGIVILIVSRCGKQLFRTGKKKKIAIILLVAISFSLTAGLYHYKKDSADGRLLIWKVTTHMIAEKPLLGWGTDGFKKNYMAFQEEYFNENTSSPYAQLADNTPFAFNEFLRITTEYGLTGLFTALLFLYSVLHNPERKEIGHPQILSVAQASATGLIIFGLFSYPLSSWQLVSVFLFFCAILTSGKHPFLQISIGGWPYLLACSFTIWLYFAYALPYKNNLGKWQETLYSNLSPPEKTAVFQRLEPEFKHPDFLLSYGRLLNQASRYDEAEKILGKLFFSHINYPAALELGCSYAGQGQISEAEKIWNRAAFMIPNRLMPLYLKMKMYDDEGLDDKAKEMATQILSKEIKLRSPEVNRILREARQLNDK